MGVRGSFDEKKTYRHPAIALSSPIVVDDGTVLVRRWYGVDTVLVAFYYWLSAYYKFIELLIASNPEVWGDFFACNALISNEGLFSRFRGCSRRNRISTPGFGLQVDSGGKN